MGRGRKDTGIVCQQSIGDCFLFGPQLSVEGHRKRTANRALITDRRADGQITKRLQNIVEATSRQADMLREVLSARDDSWRTVSRQSECLGLIELGVLKRCQSQQPISQPGRQARLLNCPLDLVTAEFRRRAR